VPCPAHNKGIEADWEKRATFSLLHRLSKSNLFYNFQGYSRLFPAPHANRYLLIDRIINMSNNINTQLTIPDIWYDFYARLLPGLYFVFIARYTIQSGWNSPNTSEILIIFIAGYFSGLLFQPVASTVTNYVFSHVQQ